MLLARAILAVVMTTAVGLFSGAAGVSAAGASAAGTSATGAANPPAAAPAKTTLTLKIAKCEGCTVEMISMVDPDYEEIWQSPEKKVRDGEVGFVVPTERTAGLSIAVNAPWEGAVPYQTMVALRYKGYQPGEKVRHSEIREAKKAAGCWAGTTETAYTMRLVVKKVRVMGHLGPVTGTIAFAKRTQEWMPPLRPVWDGVLGSQDVFACGPEFA